MFGKFCLHCGKEKQGQQKKRKYCNRNCSDQSKKGIYPESLRKNPGGKATRFKKGQLKNEKHPKWKGDQVGYFGLHTWIQRNLGRPNECKRCGKKNRLTGKSLIEWANISKKYMRDINDYIALCTSCHQWADYHKIDLTQFL